MSLPHPMLGSQPRAASKYWNVGGIVKDRKRLVLAQRSRRREVGPSRRAQADLDMDSELTSGCCQDQRVPAFLPECQSASESGWVTGPGEAADG
jgi:hypothetical protein